MAAPQAEPNHVVELRRENARLRRELDTKDRVIRSLETARDVALRLAVSGPERRSSS